MRKSLMVESLEERHLLNVAFESLATDDGNTYNYQPVLTDPVQPAFSGSIQSVLSADFNNDGKADIMTIDKSGGKAYIYLNNGSTTNAFSYEDRYIVFPSSGNSVLGLQNSVVGHLNNNANTDRADLVTVYERDSQLYIETFLGNKLGGFSFSTLTQSSYNLLQFLPSAIPTGGLSLFEVDNVELFDFDADGNNDLACQVTYTVLNGGNNVYTTGYMYLVLKGNGTGAFNTPVVINTSSINTPYAYGDVTGDSKPELITLSPSDNTRLAFYTVNGTTPTLLGTTSAFTKPILNSNVFLKQTDTDDKLEIITQHQEGNSYYIGVTNVSSSTSSVTAYYQTKIYPAYITTGDFNNDGKIDIFVSDGELYQTLLGTGNGFSETGEVIIPNAEFFTSYVADFDGDGENDVLAVGKKFAMLIPGDTAKSPSIVVNFVEKGITPQDVGFGDFNNDGKVDIAVLSDKKNEVFVFSNNTGSNSVSFNQTPTVLNVTYGKKLLVANFDNTFGDDLVVVGGSDSNGRSPNLQTFLAQQNGLVSSNIIVSTLPTGSYDAFAIGQLDSDGYLDIVAIHNDSPAYVVLKNDRQGGFAASPAMGSGNVNIPNSTGMKLTGVAVGDVTNDAQQDIVILNSGNNEIIIIPQSTDGIFNVGQARKISYSGTALSEGTCFNLAIADFNSDGYNDVLIGSLDSGDGTNRVRQFRVLENNPANPGAAFLSNTNFQNIGEFKGITTSGSLYYHVATVDNNGTPDVVIVGGNTVVKYINTNKAGAQVGTVTLVIRDYNSNIVNIETANLSTLSNRLTFIDEWSNFYVEIWANSDSSAGISEYNVALNFNADVFDVRSVTASSAFSQNFTQTQSVGKIVLSGKISNSVSGAQGDNTNVLLARVAFMPASGSGKGVAVPLNDKGVAIQPISNGFSVDVNTSSLKLTTAQSGKPTAGTSPNVTPLYPVMFDSNDDGVINVNDFLTFLKTYNKSTTDTTASVNTKLFDYNFDSIVNVNDFLDFLKNYNKSRTDAINNPSSNYITYTDAAKNYFVSTSIPAVQQAALSMAMTSFSAPMAAESVFDEPIEALDTPLSASANTQDQALLAYVDSQKSSSDNDFDVNDLSKAAEIEQLIAEGKL
ncbi:MAG: FG-GAP-like repeat-containing protein [Planctomycetaceae bacterium]|nr:FG-GAP-like repeat-containing protein [Planctomycetaceae bacterium]